jgi:hypothetical protein
VRLVEVVIEVGPDGKVIGDEPNLPAPDPSLFECASCGRRHKARTVEVEVE